MVNNVSLIMVVACTKYDSRVLRCTGFGPGQDTEGYQYGRKSSGVVGGISTLLLKRENQYGNVPAHALTHELKIFSSS